MGTNFRTEYLTIIDKILIEQAMMTGNSSTREDHEGHVTGISHRQCLFNQCFINHNEKVGPKIDTHNVATSSIGCIGSNCYNLVSVAL